MHADLARAAECLARDSGRRPRRCQLPAGGVDGGDTHAEAVARVGGRGPVRRMRRTMDAPAASAVGVAAEPLVAIALWRAAPGALACGEPPFHACAPGDARSLLQLRDGHDHGAVLRGRLPCTGGVRGRDDDLERMTGIPTEPEE